MPVNVDDVELWLKTIMDKGHIFDKYSCPVQSFYRDVVQSINRLRNVIKGDNIFRIAHLCRTTGRNHARGVHRIDNVRRRQSIGVECLRIEIHANLPIFAAARKRNCRSTYWCKLNADELVGEIKELTFTHFFAGNNQLQNRDIRSGSLQNERR